MAASIGLRFYHITLKQSNGRSATHEDYIRLRAFIEQFIRDNGSFVTSSELQRGFSFSKYRYVSGKFDISGYIRYGTFGFESDIVDTSTAEIVHRRKLGEMEQIPLFYKFWFPEGCSFALAGFQSFSGRSCKQMVVGRIYEAFGNAFKDLRLSFRKIMPEEMKGTGFFASPVKEVTLIKKSISRDRAGTYIGSASSPEIKMKFSLVAKRNGTLGKLSDVFGKAVSLGESYLIFDDIKFDEAKAAVLIGGRRRYVGLVGHNSDAGVIEISDDVAIGSDGHPDYDSISIIVDSIMKDVHSYLVGAKK